MGLRHLLNRYQGGLTDSFQRRPSRLSFMGLNTDSPQMRNLAVAFPMWEPYDSAVFGYGPHVQITGQPRNTLAGYDDDLGDVYIGDGTMGSGADVARGVTFKNSEIREFVDFGLGTSRPFSLSFWFKNNLTASGPTDMYLISFDDPASSPVAFAGFAVSIDTGNVMACNTGNNQTPDAGFKTIFNPFSDRRWHHFVLTHFPSGDLATFNATNQYFVDGKFDGENNGCADIGTCANDLFIGCDDSFGVQPFGGSFCDFRLYSGVLSESDCMRMFHWETRWDLYVRSRKTLVFVKDAPVVVDTQEWRGSAPVQKRTTWPSVMY